MLDSLLRGGILGVLPHFGPSELAAVVFTFYAGWATLFREQPLARSLTVKAVGPVHTWSGVCGLGVSVNRDASGSQNVEVAILTSSVQTSHGLVQQAHIDLVKDKALH